MASIRYICDVCGKELAVHEAYHEDSQDFCEFHFCSGLWDTLKKQRDSLQQWLESTHLKRLRELDDQLQALQERIQRLNPQ